MSLFPLKCGTCCPPCRNKLYKKYKGSPVIRLMIISAGMPSKNFLEIRYEGGYPDVSPTLIRISEHNDLRITMDWTLISLRATCSELYKFFAKFHPNNAVAIHYQRDRFIYEEVPLPDTDLPLSEIGFTSQSQLKLNLEVNSQAQIDRSAEEKAGFPIFQEEFFEDVGDECMEEIDADISAEIKEEEKKKAREKEEMKALKEEFDAKYDECKGTESSEFSPLAKESIEQNLEELLESMKSFS
eukprot:TRINITY_DN5027_c0_g4_i1.p1 TRINITY_DN5027_c0_g4~~TRINITY_DN5027_c0_g4_i1.p1  ORF type:complete len:242 (-),score=50.13 TRINITY_DN5027_c0_g4_i1:92-817(-)